MLYNPNWEVTHKVLESIYKQVDTVFIVDNSPNAQEVDFSVYKNIVYHFIGGNKGIAAAQNIGIINMLLSFSLIKIAFLL